MPTECARFAGVAAARDAAYGARVAQPVAAAEQLFGKSLTRKLLWPVALGVLAYAALLLYGDAQAVASGIATVPISALAAGLGLALGSFAVRWLRWHCLLQRIEAKVPLRVSVLILLIGLGMSITPGKVGEVLKSLLLKEAADVPVARSMPVVLAERVTDLVALLIIGLVGFFWSSLPALALGLALALLLGSWLVGRSRWLARLIVAVAGRVPVVKRYREKLGVMLESLHELWHPGTFLLSMSLALVSWQLQAVIVLVFARALGDAPVSLQQAGVAYSAPLLAGSLAFLPGGLGVTEASMAGALRSLSGLSVTGAATVTILVRLVSFWFAIALGFSALSVWRRFGARTARM